MVLALCLGGLAACAFVTLALYGHELKRMAGWLRGRDESSNGRLSTEMPGGGFVELARAVNVTLDGIDDERRCAAAEQRQFQRDLASLSHDIRTPLMGAKGYVSLAADEADPGKRAHYLRAASARLDAMGELLDQLFVYARANDPDHELEMRPVALLPVLARVLAGQYPAFEERGVQPQVHFDEEGFVAEADEEALSRIFENLVSNALRYGVGDVEIRQQGRVLAFSNQVAHPETIDASRLFERFYQADSARAQGGTGLGLAVVASLAEAMQMHVEAHLEAQTLTITLEFPQ